MVKSCRSFLKVSWRVLDYEKKTWLAQSMLLTLRLPILLLCTHPYTHAHSLADISDLKRQARPTSVNFYEFERPGLSLKSQLDRLVALSLRDQNQQLQQEYRAFEVKRGLQPAQQDAERSSRLVSLEPVSADTDLENNSALAKSLPGAGELAEQAQPTSSTLDEQAVDVAQNVYQQQQQPRNIRSSMRVSLGSLSEDILRSHFPIDSRRLYANKKAEPKSVFMHFGRK